MNLKYMLQKSNDYIISYNFEMKFSEDTYKRLKSIIHPNLRKNIEKFRIDNYFVFPNYHGCGK